MRITDTPYTPRECATFTNFTPRWVRNAIARGVEVNGAIVKLEAEILVLNGRTHHRIYEQDFITFLKAIGWKRLPRRSASLSPPLREVPRQARSAR